MQIALTKPELETYVRQEIEAGRFRTPEDLLASALTLMRDHDHLAGADVRAAIAVGLAQADRGELVPWDPDDIRRESERRIAAARAATSMAG